MESVFLITAIVGFIEWIKAVNAKDWQTAETILGAALIGGICGFFGIDHLNILTGLQIGISAPGVYKLSKNPNPTE